MRFYRWDSNETIRTMAIIKSPTQIREEQTQGLINLLNDIKASVVEDKVNLKNSLVQLNGVLERFYDYQDTQLSTADKLKRSILILEKKKCDSLSAEPRCNVHDIAEDTKTLCDTIIAEVKALGIHTRRTANDKSVNVNTTVTQSQEQHQSQQQDVIVKILLEAAKDELTGKQRKELRAIAEETLAPQEVRKSIFAKLKEFGGDVAANIVANIITNPQVWQNIGSLL